MAVIGYIIEAEDQWGTTYEEKFLMADVKQDFLGPANYGMWALGKFIEGVAGRGCYVGPEDGAVVALFQMPVFDSMTMTEIIG